MPIYDKAMDRLRQAPMSGEGTANIFEVIAAQLDATGACGAAFTLNWVPPGEVVPEGVLLPEITLRLVPNHRPADTPDDGMDS